jgi:hypothetical protein
MTEDLPDNSPDARQRVMDAMLTARPGWMDEPAVQPLSRDVRGPGVTDVRQGDVLIDPPRPREKPSEIPPNTVDGLVYLSELDGDRAWRTAGSGTGLPDGDSVNEILVLQWNGSEWVKILGYAEEDIMLCVSGTPTPYKILARPNP